MSGRGGRHGGGAGGGKRNSVMFAKPNDPSFLRRMKEQLGYKEGPSIETKREALPELGPDDTKDKDDEKPTIVVIKPGDLSAEQVEELGGLKDPDEDAVGAGNGKLIFKKPLKRSALDDVSGSSAAPEAKMEKKESSSKQLKNKSLLSFDDEEDDD